MQQSTGNPAYSIPSYWSSLQGGEWLKRGARAVDHPLLGALYEFASSCWQVGRMEAAVGYSEAGQALLDSGRDYKLPHGGEGVLGLAYSYAGQPKRAADWCRAQLERGRDTHTLTRTFLVWSLTPAGSVDEAIAAANGLIEAAEAPRNPYVLSNALLAYGYAFRETDPDRATRFPSGHGERSGQRQPHDRVRPGGRPVQR
jgi:hypothetical protein